MSAGSLPAGWLGAEVAVALTLARAVLLTRVALAVGTAVALLVNDWLLTSGSDDGSRVRPLVALALVAGVGLAELRVLPRLVEGPSRTALVMGDALVGVAVLLIGGGDAAYVIQQSATAALVTVLVGARGIVLVVGLVLQSVAVGWLVLASPDVSPGRTGLLLAAPVLVLAAGGGLLAWHRRLTARLWRVLQTAPGAAGEVREEVLTILPRRERGTGLVADLAWDLAGDAVAARSEAAEPVQGVRFDRPGVSFAEQVETLCRKWSQKHGPAPALSLAPVALSPAARHGLAVILDGALENVAQHASATRVQIDLFERRGRAVLEITDDGDGFVVPAAEAAMRSGRNEGLVGMADRAVSLGATFSIDSEPGSGTVIQVRMPR